MSYSPAGVVLQPLEIAALRKLEEFKDFLGGFPCYASGIFTHCPESMKCSYCDLARHLEPIRVELNARLKALYA